MIFRYDGKTLKENGISLAFGQAVTKLEGANKVERVITDKGSYDCDMAVLALGFAPNSSLGKDKIKTYPKIGAYLVDKRQMTNIPDVYAIGDCAVVYDNSTQDQNYIALATNAVRSGIIAAYNACGAELETNGVQGSNGIRVYGMNMVATGLTLEKQKAWDRRAVYRLRGLPASALYER